LQKLDSNIAEEVMIDLYAQDIVVLPIHDSFIVRKGDEGYLKSAMNRAFQKHVDAIPGLKSDTQDISLDDWLLDIKNDRVLSGSDMVSIINDGIGEYIMFETRQSQWRAAKGLSGLD